MKILHITDDLDLSQIIINSLREKPKNYDFINFADLRESDNFYESNKNMCEYNLIIIEMNDIEYDYKMIIEHFKKCSLFPISIIVIANSMDFSTRKNLYDIGVMTVVDREKFNSKRLNKYIDMVKNEIDTIRALKDMKIAVVDDSKFSLKIVKEFFKQYELYNVDYYSDSEEFVDKNIKYDIYILDLVMPVYDGEELIYHIKDQNNNSIIILVTKYSDGRSLELCLSIGADDFILKPINPKLFMLRLTSCIKKYKLNLENVNKTELLYQMATIDSLTGVYNRRYFIEHFSKKFVSSCEKGNKFSVILFDLDNFKQINDEYGHHNGDIVLKRTADLVSNLIRKTDIFCRWGGEEFIILLPNAKIQEATIVAEKIRREIEKMKIDGIKKITISLGVTQCVEDDTEEDIFKRVDNSLYLAKLTGRNKVVYNEELFISKGGVPLNIDWGPFFRSGHPQVDDEHHKLISLSNEIIINCFNDNKYEETVKLFKELLDHVVYHFDQEEKVLEEHLYSDLENHKRIHMDLSEKAVNMYRLLEEKKISTINVAKYIVQDVVVGHIVKSDFDFFHLFN